MVTKPFTTFATLVLIGLSAWADDNPHYVIETLPTPEDVPFEVSGLEFLPDGRLAASIRKGEVWLIENATAPPGEQRFKRIAEALHEPLGLVHHDGALYTVQRSELTRLEDRNGDDVIDAYITINNAWGLTGNYHEYAFGPVIDAQDHFWITLNQTIGEKVLNNDAWRGWGARITPDGVFEPIAAGMRSPSGIGSNTAGDIFFTDQQGNWVPTGTLHHLRKGVFYGHPESLKHSARPESPLEHPPEVPQNKPYPEAVAADSSLVPPAVWFPYKKAGMSATDVIADSTGGAFGPFSEQLFIGEFTMSAVNRVFLEKVSGEYQGGCIPFRSGFRSAVLRFAWGPDNCLYVGESNRGWNSVGSAPFGLERIRWTGEAPFEILRVSATPMGFNVEFTSPADPAVADGPSAWNVLSYTYNYHRDYGSEEIQTQEHVIESIEVASDGRSAHLIIPDRRPGYVHEIHAEGIRDKNGQSLVHPTAYYTLNTIPHPETTKTGES